MPNYNYDWRWYRDKPSSQRFPEWAEGYRHWVKMSRRQAWKARDPLELLPERRDLIARVAENLPCPRVFISHRQADKALALRAAWLAHDAGFNYWLDVLDPDLTSLERSGRRLTADEKARVIAAIIEMALLNSTHVLALITSHTRGSLWVPYEYGRVKEAAPETLKAGCWRDPRLSSSDFPEYLHLGVITRDESELKRWYREQFQQWTQTYNTCSGGSEEPWPTTEPQRLPS